MRRPATTVLSLMTAALPLVVAAARPAHAQHGGGADPLVTRAPAEAMQWDFLVGQWDLAVMPQGTSLAARIHGLPKMKGTWKAWRAFEGFGIEDEMRIVDASGNARALSHFLRVYAANDRAWKIVGTDIYRGVVGQSTATWANGVMEVVGNTATTDADGKRYTTRTRFSDISATSFRYVQERSFDDGKTWEATLKIDAKRVAATAPR